MLDVWRRTRTGETTKTKRGPLLLLFSLFFLSGPSSAISTTSRIPRWRAEGTAAAQELQQHYAGSVAVLQGHGQHQKVIGAFDESKHARKISPSHENVALAMRSGICA